MGSSFDKTYNQIITFLQPYLNKQNQISDAALATGNKNVGAGTEGIDNLIKYYTNFASGSRDDILKNVDLSGITKSYDQAEGNLANFGVRGGRSAGQLAGLNFDKAAQINKIVQALRESAPHELENLYGTLLNLGTGQVNTAIGVNQSNLGAVTNATSMALQKKMADDANRAAMISSIFGAAGGALGAYLGRK
jgi:hypothetical protein